jgi:hypothetical protein
LKDGERQSKGYEGFPKPGSFVRNFKIKIFTVLPLKKDKADPTSEPVKAKSWKSRMIHKLFQNSFHIVDLSFLYSK